MKRLGLDLLFQRLATFLIVFYIFAAATAATVFTGGSYSGSYGSYRRLSTRIIIVLLMAEPRSLKDSAIVAIGQCCVWHPRITNVLVKKST